MPQKVLQFTGINRKVNEFHGQGTCEELINLRPEIGGGYHVVKPKDVVMTNTPYIRIYVHTFGNVYNLIGVTNDGSIYSINEAGNTIQALTIDTFTSDDVEITTAGNVLLAYSKTDKKQASFKYENESYSVFEFTPIEIVESYVQLGDEAQYSVTADDYSLAGLNDALAKAASGFQSNYPNGLYGSVVVGCTYELEDGNEVWSTAFVVSSFDSEPTSSAETLKVTVIGRNKANLILKLKEGAPANCKFINIYSTRPTLCYEFKEVTTNGVVGYRPSRLSDDDINLDGQLMYYQGRVTPDKAEISFSLDFGQGLGGEKVMPVTSGCIERTGSTVSYNNRFYFYDSEAQHVIQRPTISLPAGARETTDTWVAYVKFEKGWKQIEKGYKFSATAVQDFIYPMTGISQLAFVKLVETTQTKGVTYDRVPTGTIYFEMTKDCEMFYVDLEDSDAYNYSFAFNVTPTLVSAADFYSLVKKEGQLWGVDEADTKVLLKDESNAINISAAYNPFVFPVEYSYSFGGQVKEITTSYLPISSTQVGQYPVTVFTSNGIFSMEQGDGNVLYSNILPLQPHVIDGKATATPYGTFFVSSKNVFLLSGREAVNISSVLNGERELKLRENEAYNKLCNGEGYICSNFTPLLSDRDFEEYIQSARMTYDQLNNELYISSTNTDINYSYVLNIDSKQYFKVGKKYIAYQNGSRYAIEHIGTDRNLVDLHNEHKSKQQILMQSRPLSLEAFYTHIQRLLMLVDAKLTDNQYLCLSVFASDNLYDWKCIISSQKHNTVLRHIRTNKAAKSFKDYIILINGVVNTDTDISDIIADYTVVNRRLG